MPVEYARFTERRALWKELGMSPDNTTHEEWQEAATFLRLEAKHEKKDK